MVTIFKMLSAHGFGYNVHYYLQYITMLFCVNFSFGIIKLI